MAEEEIPITKNTLKKMLCYAKLMKERECYGILVCPKDVNDGIIYDAVFATNQKVTGASAQIEDDAVATTKAEIINSNYKSIGFWHSHAGFGAWHSHTDDGNLERLCLDFALNTETVIEREKGRRGYNIFREPSGWVVSSRFKNYPIEIRIKSRDSILAIKRVGETEEGIKYNPAKKILDITCNGELLRVTDLEQMDFKITIPKKEKIGGRGFAYSVVVNQKGECYGEIIKSEWCYLFGHIETEKIKGVKINPVEVGSDVKFSEEELKEEIRRKILR